MRYVIDTIHGEEPYTDARWKEVCSGTKHANMLKIESESESGRVVTLVKGYQPHDGLSSEELGERLREQASMP